MEEEQSEEVREKYRIKEQDRSCTREEFQQQVDREQRLRQLGPFGLVWSPVPEQPVGADDRLDAQAVQLKQGVLARSAPADPGADYLGYSHEELHAMVNTDVGPGVVDEAGSTWTSLGNSLATFTDTIVGALVPSETEWTGEAGDKARQALADFGNHAGEAGKAAQLAGTLAAQQARALADVKNQVPPPPAAPFDPRAAAAHRAQITDPVAYAQQGALDAAQFAAERQAHEEAARRVEAYDRTMAQIAGAQPAFAPPPPAPPPEPQPQPNPIGRKIGTQAVGDQDTLSTPDTPTTPPAPADQDDQDGQDGQDDDTTKTSGTSGLDTPPKVQPQDERRGPERPSLRPGVDGVTLPPARIGTDRPSAGRGGGTGRVGSGAGGVGAGRVTGSPGLPPGGQNGQSAGVVGRSGPGVPVDARGTATSRGGVGPAGFGGIAGAPRGQDDEDIEHTTKYLEPTDELFTEDERQVAPPVLGE